MCFLGHSGSSSLLTLLRSPKFAQDDDRRIAEVQYKRCCALQFSGELTKALPAVQVGYESLAQAGLWQ